MKGIVFTEFIEMVEEAFSPDVADHIIEASDLASDGIYTSLGTYPHSEFVQLVLQLSKAVGKPTSELIQAFGEHLAHRFATGYPQFFAHPSLFDFLEQIETYIHVEVRKLYIDAELPSFTTVRGGDHLVMHYSSSRPFADLAYGLILGTAAHFGEEVHVEYDDLSANTRPGTSARFTITKT